MIKRESNERGNSLDLVRNNAKRQIELKIDIGVDNFYE